MCECPSSRGILYTYIYVCLPYICRLRESRQSKSISHTYIYICVSPSSRGISYTYKYVCLPYTCLPLRKSRYIYIFMCVSRICVERESRVERNIVYIHVYVSPSAQESRGISDHFMYVRLSYVCLPLRKSRYIYIYVSLPYVWLPLRKSREVCRIHIYICVCPIYVSPERESRSISHTFIYMCLPLRKSQEAYHIRLCTCVTHICDSLFGRLDIYLNMCLAYMCLPLRKSRKVNCIHLHLCVSLFSKVEKYFLFIYTCVSPIYVSPSSQESRGISYIYIYIYMSRMFVSPASEESMCIHVCVSLFGRVDVYTYMCPPLRKSRNVFPIHILYVCVSHICVCLPYMCVSPLSQESDMSYIYIYMSFSHICVFLAYMCLPLRKSRNVFPIHRYICVSAYIFLPYVCLPYMCVPLRKSREVYRIHI